MSTSIEQVSRILRDCLERGATVEIDGLGIFRRNGDGRFRFTPQTRPRVFLAYAAEDAAAVERLFDDLAARGLDPWMDRRKLLPGQNWPRAIERTIAISDFFIACFSKRSIAKRGSFQAELRYALDCAARVPLDAVFLIPVRLEECEVPEQIRGHYQYVDLFPDWGRGVDRIAAVCTA